MTSAKREDARCEFLHEVCGRIESWIAGGITLRAAVLRAARYRRACLFKQGGLAPKTLGNLFRMWKQCRTPEVFRRHWKPGHAHIPVALLLEFLNRLASEQIVPGAVAIQSLRADWKMGRLIPGLGTWRDYQARSHGESGRRTTAPRFPFAYRSLIRYLPRGSSGSYQKQVRNALRAQREVTRFLVSIDELRQRLEMRIAHDALDNGTSNRRPSLRLHRLS